MSSIRPLTVVAACLVATAARADKPPVDPVLPRMSTSSAAPISPYPPGATEPEVQEAWRKLAPAEAEMLLKVQRQLGGSIVDQVMPLEQPRLSDPAPATVPERPTNPTGPRERQQIRALREAARRIEECAARLEDLGLYGHADRSRELASQIRLDARRLAGDGTPSHPAQAIGDMPVWRTEVGPSWPQLLPGETAPRTRPNPTPPTLVPAPAESQP